MTLLRGYSIRSTATLDLLLKGKLRNPLGGHSPIILDYSLSTYKQSCLYLLVQKAIFRKQMSKPGLLVIYGNYVA